MKPFVFHLSLLFLYAATVSAGPPKMVTLRTRPNVKLSFLLDEPNQIRRGTLIILVGGNGTGAYHKRKGGLILGDERAGPHDSGIRKEGLCRRRVGSAHRHPRRTE